MVRGLALLALLSADIPPEGPTKKGCSVAAEPVMCLGLFAVLGAPLLLLRRRNQPA